MKRLTSVSLGEYFEVMTECMVAHDVANGTIVGANAAFRRMVQRDDFEILGEAFKKLIHPDDRVPTDIVIRENQHTGLPSVHFVNRWARGDGEYRWLEWTSTNTVIEGLSIVVARDVTHYHERATELERMAHFDRVTGFPNRYLAQDRFEQAARYADRKERCFVGVGFFDLVGFKKINDTHGHQAGDLVLHTVAGRMAELVRSTDTVCRWGGDEFVVLLPYLNSIQGGHHVLHRITKHVQKPMSIAGKETAIQISMGMSAYPNSGKTLDECVKKADQAMYRDKRVQHAVLSTEAT